MVPQGALSTTLKTIYLLFRRFRIHPAAVVVQAQEHVHVDMSRYDAEYP